LQDTVDMNNIAFPVDSFHCEYPRKMGFHRMDPSCAIGFYCRTKDDFDRFCKEAVDVLKPPLQRTEYPMFVFDEGSCPTDTNIDLMDGFMYSRQVHERTVNVEVTSSKKKHNKNKKKDKHKQAKTHMEEYVLVE